MSAINLSSPSPNAADRRGLSTREPAGAGIVQRGIGLLQIWRERHHGRAELIGMSDGMLKDIGLSRSDAELEYEKPFWRN